MGRIYIEQGIIFWIKTVVKTRRIAILPLQALGEPVNYWDIIIHLMTTKLDTVTKREWGKNSISYNWRYQTIELHKFSGNPMYILGKNDDRKIFTTTFQIINHKQEYSNPDRTDSQSHCCPTNSLLLVQ